VTATAPTPIHVVRSDSRRSPLSRAAAFVMFL
jgi:hypothetical protein